MKVFLYLHDINVAQASWVIVDDPANTVIQTELHTDLEQLIIADTTEVIAIIPATDVLLTEAKLPKMNSYRLQQAIPFAIEEQLLNDLVQLHFAHGPHLMTGCWPVAVITIEKITAWLHYLKKYHIFPQQMLSASLAIPFIKNHWSVYSWQDSCLVRTDDFAGFGCETENLLDYLKIKLSEAVLPPEQIDSYAIDNTEFSMDMPVPISPHLISEKEFLEALPNTISDHFYINLLQGVFRPQYKTTQSKKIWRYVAYITSIWVTLGLASYLILFLMLDYHAYKINSQIKHIYHRYFPGTVSVIAPRERMSEQLNKSSNQITNASFLGLLANIGQAIKQIGGLHLQSLDYRDKQLILTLFANNFEQIDKLSESLHQRNLTTRRQSAEALADKVKVSLQVSTR